MQRTKLQVLEARHSDLREKVHAMFNACWPAVAVQQLLEAEYGARLGLSSVERYKRAHWRAQQERIRQASRALSDHRFIGSSDHRFIGSLNHWVIDLSGH